MSYLFNTFLYQPIINILVLLYNSVALGDFGVAIIMLTVMVRLALYPMYHKMLHQQTLMQKLRPEMKKIQDEYKDDKEKQTKLLLELYREHKIKPFHSFLVLLIQLPILWALFRAFTNTLNGSVSNLLYSFISAPEAFNPIFLGILNLNERNVPLIILTAIVQFFQMKISSTINKPAEGQKSPMPSGNIMGGFIAVFTVFILWSLPSAVALYWLTSTLFSLGQQFVCNKTIKDAELKGNNR
ncbi:MAG: YidC/Oxa1 family membrane protein insertase [Candidatus Colwellbacteria bacterium]|jgi:YidC/Oxa1 family membrane protein insertase|nr:YidC/Oxa1 family membrane protein insertase [Candidatus Colwellbacteria bacterium]MCK9497305.1 YidC/Oxa1 family membrane protein insertase [Candidatus Colwellbacteria bacterium]MDD3752352.1 YidC/Oxa1 family membrane protein insertase [Candidatus Colwellbacteria bacterium]MDD4818581.1 YidC/Oxa1 family membrane protein insertase [Candidatus Colwellbacteria bacterium]